LSITYSTLTRFCRRLRIGQSKDGPDPAGHYAFGPGEESQNDTSPVSILVGPRTRIYQATVLKHAWSAARYLQFYRKFRRFHCKHFLAESFTFLKGVCGRCVIDNTSVVIVRGTGANAVVAPEIQAFEKRFGFQFLAREKGHSDRKAHVEREIRFVQDNFLKGRTFRDDNDLNEQAREWCRKKNTAVDRKRQSSPDDLLLDHLDRIGILEATASNTVGFDPILAAGTEAVVPE